MEILFLGRFQPLHLGHKRRIKIAEKFGTVRPVVFTYTVDGKPYLGKSFLLTFDEIKHLFSLVGVEVYKLELEVGSLGEYLSHFRPPKVLEVRRRLRELGEYVMTSDVGNLMLIKLFGLQAIYIPKGNSPIRGEVIRNLVYEGKIDKACKFLPEECREAFKRMVEGKDLERIKQRSELRIWGFKLPKTKI